MNAIKRLIDNLKLIVCWLKSIVSEQDGLGSASRVVKLMVVCSSAFCLIFVTLKKGDLPTADQLKALAQVIGMGSAAYAANQLKTALSKGDKSDS